MAQKAVALWNQAKPVQTHPYLVAKQVAAHGLRRDRRNKLLVPMQDIDGRLWGVQTITLDGRKLFMRDGRKRGMHAVLGELQPGATVAIAEDFATAATVREATELPAIVAFDSGNLMDVARSLRERDPERPIIIAADNDHHLPRRQSPLPNVGQEKATAAARAVAGIVLTPAFASTDKGIDWNDYAAQHGKATVRAQYRRHFACQAAASSFRSRRSPTSGSCRCPRIKPLALRHGQRGKPPALRRRARRELQSSPAGDAAAEHTEVVGLSRD